MTTPSNPNQPQGLTPNDLAEQLFNVAFAQNMKDPKEAARQVIEFLASSLFYAITMTKGDVIVFLTDTLIRVIAASSPDDSARKELLKHVSEIIAGAQVANAPAAPPAAPTVSPAGTPTVVKPAVGKP